MKKALFTLVFALVAATTTAFGQTKMAPDPKVEAQLIALEKAAWAAAESKQPTWFETNLAPDFAPDSAGTLLAPADLDKVLKHHGDTFDDVVVENVFTTDMAGFLKYAGYRNGLYRQHFPTGSWIEVKGLALPGQLIEIELEAHRSR